MFNRTVPLCLGDPVFINERREYRRVIDANTARNYGKCASSPYDLLVEMCVFGKLRNLFARGKYRRAYRGASGREGVDWTVNVYV